MAELSTAEAARRAAVPERTLRSWIAGGKLVAVKRGRHYRIPAEALAAATASNGTPLPHASAAATATAANGRTAAAAADVVAADVAAGMAELVRLVRDQQQTILELSGRCGYLQAELAQARAALEAPKMSDTTPEPEAVSRASTRRWWQFW